MTPNRAGLVIGAAFGLVYVLVNATALASPAGRVVQAVGVVAFVAVLVALWRARSAPIGEGPPREGFGPVYWIVLAAELVAMFGGNLLLNGPLALPEGVLPWITLVVGVHFLPLGRLWRAPSLGWLGAGLAVLGAVGLVLAATGASHAVVATVAGLCPGAVLLGGSLWAAARQGSGRPPAQVSASKSPRTQPM